MNTDFQSNFLLSLKKYLQNSILTNIRQKGFDRIIYFDFEKLNLFGDVEKYTLIFEIMGRASNIFLTSHEKILSALHFSTLDEGNRIIMTGAKYTSKVLAGCPLTNHLESPTLRQMKLHVTSSSAALIAGEWL